MDGHQVEAEVSGRFDFFLPRWAGRLIDAAICTLVLSIVACCEIKPSLSFTAQQALEKRDYATAERLYRTVLAEDSHSFEALNNLGIALFLEGKQTQAIHYFHLALQQRFSLGTYALLASARCGTRDLESARPMLAKIRVEQIRDLRILALVAPCFADTGDLIGAIRAYEALRGSGQLSEDEILIKLARTYLSATQWFFARLEKAEKNEVFVQAVKNARESGSMSARSAFSLARGRSPYLKEDITFPEALRHLSLHPRDAPLLYVLSVLSGEQAMHMVLQCEDEYSDSSWLQQLRAEMLANQGREAEAQTAYEQLLEQNSNLPRLRTDLADLYRKRKSWERALPLFQQEMSANKEDEHAAAGVSESLLMLGRYVDLKAFLEPIVSRDYVPLWASLDLATAHQKLGEHGQAINVLLVAERGSPANRAIHYRLMRLYYQTGETALAKKEKSLFLSRE